VPGLTGSGERPPDDVIAAFGGRGAAVALDGGQGRTFVAGDIVLKPVGHVAEATWAAEVLSTVEEDGFRVARPVRGTGGAWVVGEWTAFERVDGEHRTWGGPWPDVVEACGRFHAALASVARPPWLDRRQDLFAEADRIAWGERAAELPSPVAGAVARLRALTRPVAAPDQVVHGDFAGNVLLADGLPPAVIDFSPYWRPAGYPTALTVVDAVLWYGEGVGLTVPAASVPELDQLLVRALLFRLAVDGLQLRDRAPGVRWDDAQVEWDLGHAEPLLRHLEQRQRTAAS
jgi:uncharacterized protein (TIGR02569 family)